MRLPKIKDLVKNRKPLKPFAVIRLLLCVAIILVGVSSAFDSFFKFTEYVVTAKGNYMPVLSSLSFYISPNLPGTIIYVALVPVGIYFLIEKRVHAELVPRIAFSLSLVNIVTSIVMSVYISSMFDFSLVLLFGFSAAMLMSASSFYRGHYHSLTRLMILSFATVLLILFQIVVSLAIVSNRPITLYNMLSQYPSEWVLILAYVLFACLTIYPDDFPTSHLNKELRETEYMFMCNSDLCIVKEDLDAVTGRDMSRWTPSHVPGVSSEVSVNLYGGKGGYVLTARKWNGDDSVYVSVDSVTERASAWGSGFKLVHTAYDNSVSSRFGRPVRMYTGDGFFLRFVEIETKPVVVNRYVSALAKFFQK